jgi:hypothetical protein
MCKINKAHLRNNRTMRNVIGYSLTVHVIGTDLTDKEVDDHHRLESNSMELESLIEGAQAFINSSPRKWVTGEDAMHRRRELWAVKV